MTETVVSFFSVGGLGFAAVVYGLDRFNLLPKKRGPLDAAAEAMLADRAVERALKERDDARAERDRIKKEFDATRSLEPIIDQLAVVARQNGQNAEISKQVLDRLVHHNGSFRHMEEAMSDIRESLKTLTGFVLGVHEIPLEKQT